MASLEQIRSSNAQITEASVPKTSVFVGGTDGIGKATLVNLVSRGFPIKVYIVGRNKNGHRGLLNELSKLNPSAILVYVEGQISLLGETSRIVNQIASQEDKVDLLFLSAGYLPFNGRVETSEGLEKSQVVCYYSHILFITRLLSQLRNASTPSQPARVVNILAAGRETTNIFLDDLTLKEAGHFNIPNFAGHAATSMTLTLKKIAEAPENKNVVFIHAHPGRVSTNLMTKSLGNKLDPSQLPSGPGGTFVQLTPEEAGDRCIYLITSAEFGEKGVRIPSERKAGQTLVHTLDGSLFSVSDKMEIVQQDELLGNLEKMGASQKIWDHTFDFLNSLS